MTNLEEKMKASLINSAILSALLAGCAQYGPVEDSVPVELPFLGSTENIGTEQIHAYQIGSGRPSVVMMHGIPTSSALWRNVAPIVARDATVTAFDLPGYGQSSLPADGDYSYESLYRITEDYLNARPEREFVLVVNDLGSLLGIDYAMRNPDRVSGLVFVEAAFMPAQEWLAQVPFEQRAGFWAFRNFPSLADALVVRRPFV